MTYEVTIPTTEVMPGALAVGQTAIEALKLDDREITLKNLFDPRTFDENGFVIHGTAPTDSTQFKSFPNYEFAKDSGLLDQFFYDPDSGRDAIVHILTGDMIETPEGAREVSGFHHEYSAANYSDTYVTTDLTKMNSSKKRDYRHLPYEPYNAQVTVRNYPKQVFVKNAEGKAEAVKAHSSMYPSEYDAIAVLQAARIARDTRDKSNDRSSHEGTEEVIVTEGQIPLIDGQHFMPIRLILDSKSEQIITAFPIVSRSRAMKISPDVIQQRLGLSGGLKKL